MCVLINTILPKTWGFTIPHLKFLYYDLHYYNGNIVVVKAYKQQHFDVPSPPEPNIPVPVPPSPDFTAFKHAIPDCAGDNCFVTFRCPSCGETYRFKLGCHLRICPTCNKSKAHQLISKYRNIDTNMVEGNAYFVTPTIKNVKPDRLKEGVIKLRSSIRKLCKRAPYRRWFAGGLYAIEFTYNRKRDDFNLHAHMCVDSCIDLKRAGLLGYASDNPDKVKKGLKQDWYEVTGDSYIIDWQKTKYPKKAVSYCLKYVSKEAYYGRYDMKVCEALYKTRMIAFFGCLYYAKGIPKLPFHCECGYCDGLEFVSVDTSGRGGYWFNGHYLLNPAFNLDNFT
jgi:Replication protein.